MKSLLILAFIFLGPVQASNHSYTIDYSQKNPGNRAFGLTFDQNLFWTSVEGKEGVDIVGYDPHSYTITERISFPSYRWIYDLDFNSKGHLIFVGFQSHNPQIKLLVCYDIRAKKVISKQEFPTDFGMPSALQVDGEYLWLATLKPNRILRLKSENLEIQKEFTIMEGYPYGITLEGPYIWLSLNSHPQELQIKKLRKSDGEEILSFPFYEAIGAVSGIYHKGNHLWAISNVINRLFKLKIEKNTSQNSPSPIDNREERSLGLNDNRPAKKFPNRKFSYLKSSHSTPSKFSWINHLGKDWTTPIKDQHNCGACVSFSTLAQIEAQYKIYYNNPRLDLNLSEQQAFSCLEFSSCSIGAGITDVLEQAKEDGLVDESCSLYRSGRTGENIECQSCPEIEKRKYFIEEIFTATDYGLGYIPEIKRALLNGPLLTRMYVFDDFFYYTKGIYKHKWGSYKGRHAVLIVGYDDSTQSFLVRNSWGNQWGEKGLFRIHYDDVSSVGAVTYGITISTDKPIISFQSLYHPQVVTNSPLIVDLVASESDDEALKGKITYHNSSEVLQSFDFKSGQKIWTEDLKDGAYDFIIEGSNNYVTSFIINTPLLPETLTIKTVEKKAQKTKVEISCGKIGFLEKVVLNFTTNNRKEFAEIFFPCPETTKTLFHIGDQIPGTIEAIGIRGEDSVHANTLEILPQSTTL